jgi:hypothetical protein
VILPPTRIAPNERASVAAPPTDMQMFEAMGRAIAASGIKPVIDKMFPFDGAQAA